MKVDLLIARHIDDPPVVQCRMKNSHGIIFRHIDLIKANSRALVDRSFSERHFRSRKVSESACCCLYLHGTIHNRTAKDPAARKIFPVAFGPADVFPARIPATAIWRISEPKKCICDSTRRWTSVPPPGRPPGILSHPGSGFPEGSVLLNTLGSVPLFSPFTTAFRNRPLFHLHDLSFLLCHIFVCITSLHFPDRFLKRCAFHSHASSLILRSKGLRRFFMKLVDLHVHSTCSDGTLTPSRTVSLAKKTGLSSICPDRPRSGEDFRKQWKPEKEKASRFPRNTREKIFIS